MEPIVLKNVERLIALVIFLFEYLLHLLRCGSGANEARLYKQIEELQWGGAARSQMTSGRSLSLCRGCVKMWLSDYTP